MERFAAPIMGCLGENKFTIMKHYSFPSIGQFYHARKELIKRATYVGRDKKGDPVFNNTLPLPVVEFEGTVKLHGTNAAIVFLPEGEEYFQSRENVVTPENDNFGFARMMKELSHSFDEIRKNFDNTKIIVLYGEWAGEGLKNNAAITKLTKAFYLFAAFEILPETDEFGANLKREIDITGWKMPLGFFNIKDFPSFKVNIDLQNPEPAIIEINKLVSTVEKCCPVAAKMGVEGIGEGLVFKPTDDRLKESRFWFKTKGAEHSNSQVRVMVTVDPVKYATEQKFLEVAASEERLEQGFNFIIHNFGSASEKNTGDFLRWLFNDVVKEMTEEMKLAGIEEKNLGKMLAQKARPWYFARLNKI